MGMQYTFTFQDKLPKENIMIEETVANRIHCATFCKEKSSCKGFGFDSKKTCFILDLYMNENFCDAETCSEKNGVKIYMSKQEATTTTETPTTTTEKPTTVTTEKPTTITTKKPTTTTTTTKKPTPTTEKPTTKEPTTKQPTTPTAKDIEREVTAKEATWKFTGTLPTLPTITMPTITIPNITMPNIPSTFTIPTIKPTIPPKLVGIECELAIEPVLMGIIAKEYFFDGQGMERIICIPYGAIGTPFEGDPYTVKVIDETTGQCKTGHGATGILITVREKKLEGFILTCKPLKKDVIETNIYKSAATKKSAICATGDVIAGLEVQLEEPQHLQNLICQKLKSGTSQGPGSQLV